MEFLIVVLLVVICVILIMQIIYTERAIRETNHTIAEHLHGISHRVTDLDQNLKGINDLLNDEIERRALIDFDKLTAQAKSDP